jgi:hypothetical protein
MPRLEGELKPLPEREAVIDRVVGEVDAAAEEEGAASDPDQREGAEQFVAGSTHAESSPGAKVPPEAAAARIVASLFRSRVDWVA